MHCYSDQEGHHPISPTMAEVLHRTSDPPGISPARIDRARSNSAKMDHPRDRSGKTSADFEAYFDELEEIQRTSSHKRSDTNGSNESNGSHSGAGGLSESEDEILKTPEDGEVEIKWLERAGLGSLANTIQDGQELEEEQIFDATSTLTKSQAAAVKKRIEKLNDTLRKKRKPGDGTDGSNSSPSGGQSRVRDVRDIFPPNGDLGDHTGYSVTDGALMTKRTRGTHRKSKTLPDAYSSDKALSKFRESSGIADLNTGVKVLSFTHTEPIEVPSVKKGEHDDFLRSKSADNSTLELHAVEDTIVRQEDLLKSLSATLPNITIQRDKLGVTPVHFLSTKDIDRVRQIALIELTAVFDRLNLTYTSHRKSSKKRFKDEGIFGVPLSTVVEHDRQFKSDTDVPLFLQKMVAYLEENGLREEGVLRVPGSSSRVKQLRDEAESTFYTGKFRFDDLRINDIVGLLKQFLRDLPTPLLTLDYVNAFAAVEKIKDRRKQLQCLNLLILVLPDIHRATLKLLLKFLGKIVDNELENKMSLNNVSMIMAPNLFSVQTSRKKNVLNYSELHIAAGTCNIMRMMIKYHQILWVVPFRMLEQVRSNHEILLRKAKDKSVMGNIFRKGSKDKKPSIEAEALGGVIRVMMPGPEKVWNTVQLSEKTVAGDIVQRFTQYTKPPVAVAATTTPPTEGLSFKRGSVKRRSRRKTFQSGDRSGGECEIAGLMNIVPTKSRYYLYEMGGNIGERCLDPDTNMMALARVNPGGEWGIRARTK